MKSFSLSLAIAALIAALSLGLASHPAAAISIEDSAGNPDVQAPLTDPDDATSNDQGDGFHLAFPSQDTTNGTGTGSQWIFSMPTSSGTTTDGQQSQ